MKNGIFISYRHEGGSTIANIIYDELCQHFIRENIFKDVNSLNPGADFKEEIRKAISLSCCMLVLIDKTWAGQKDASGKIRAFQKDDFVRFEIRTAVENGLAIIPLLFEGGQMPDSSKLPKDISLLCSRHAYTIKPETVMHDIKNLPQHIRSLLPYHYEEGTIIGSYERLFKNPGEIKKGFKKSVDLLKKDAGYIKDFLKKVTSKKKDNNE